MRANAARTGDRATRETPPSPQRGAALARKLGCQPHALEAGYPPTSVCVCVGALNPTH